MQTMSNKFLFHVREMIEMIIKPVQTSKCFWFTLFFTSRVWPQLRSIHGWRSWGLAEIHPIYHTQVISCVTSVDVLFVLFLA